MEREMVHSHEYDGRYVAMASDEDNTIVGSGKTPEDALKEARKKGIRNPFLLYVPDKNSVHIYLSC
jgi:NADPH-dependent glutamate synthase beta subunit-like oxidoreductase